MDDVVVSDGGAAVDYTLLDREAAFDENSKINNSLTVRCMLIYTVTPKKITWL